MSISFQGGRGGILVQQGNVDAATNTNDFIWQNFRLPLERRFTLGRKAGRWKVISTVVTVEDPEFKGFAVIMASIQCGDADVVKREEKGAHADDVRKLWDLFGDHEFGEVNLYDRLHFSSCFQTTGSLVLLQEDADHGAEILLTEVDKPGFPHFEWEVVRTF